jgi:hypothetical protein
LSTTTKTFGFNKPELTDAADITAMNQNWDKADDEIAKAKGTNPNLLDNWYFADPINQRAKSSYSGSGYGIDRWTMIEADGSVKLESDGITVYRQLRQYIENPNDVFGKQITASVLTSDGTLHTGTMTPANSDGGQLIVDDTTIHLYMYIVKSAASGNVSFIIECRESVTIQAVKLEFGSQQTLARQDETGKWVLNSMPPNKTLETIKCGSSTDDVNDPYANSKTLYKNLGAAPAGFGLGEGAKRLTSADNLDEIWKSGFYTWGDSAPQNAPVLGDEAEYNYMEVCGANETTFTQKVYSGKENAKNLSVIRGFGNYGNTGWEWVNPPMIVGVEYRTTERFLGQPVYTMIRKIGGFTGNATCTFGESGYHAVVRIFATASYGGVRLKVDDSKIKTIQHSAGYVYVQVSMGSETCTECYVQMWYTK